MIVKMINQPVYYLVNRLVSDLGGGGAIMQVIAIFLSMASFPLNKRMQSYDYTRTITSFLERVTLSGTLPFRQVLIKKSPYPE